MIAVMKLISEPIMRPGSISGTVTDTKVFAGEAPRLTAASSMDGLICLRIDVVERTP
ncbi:hypothetical protein D3C71_2242010 [compost metagenome]